MSLQNKHVFSLTKQDLALIDKVWAYHNQTPKIQKFMSKLNKIQNYINHIVLVVDKSGSMNGLQASTIKVFDNQIKFLAKRSQELNQETRVSVYLFGSNVECLVFDIDVMRLPSLADYYEARDGSTALIDGTIKAIDEVSETPQRYGEHGFLLYALTDGQNNVNNHLAPTLAKKLSSLPENWTVAVFVPNANGIHEAKRFGFPANNISVWSTDKVGMEEAGNTMQSATNNYMVGRATTGLRGTKNLFQLDASVLTKTAVKNNLQELKPTEYEVLLVRSKTPIKPFVESWLKSYTVGSAYYQLTKEEKIQASKAICIQEKRNGKVYSGQNARNLLGLPSYEVKVSPTDFQEFNIFVQSTSTNRNLVEGTQLIVLK